MGRRCHARTEIGFTTASAFGAYHYSPVYIREKRRDLEQIAIEGILGSS